MQWFTKALTQYADFHGRARRTEYWMYTLFWTIGFVVLYAVDFALLFSVGIGGLSLLYLLGTIVPSLAVGARRLHDTNRSGWWQLISLVPFVGSIVLIVFCATEGEFAPNRWGPNPKAMAGGYNPAMPV